MNWKEFIKGNALKLLAGGFVIGVGFVGVASAMLHATGTPTFCGQCHSMQHEATTFAMSSHRDQDCVECHLPHDNSAIYLIEKGRTGIVDMYHEVMRDYPERIELSAESRMMVNKNCMRCHEKTMYYVSTPMIAQDSGDCLKCHSRIAHGSNHLEGGIELVSK